MTSLNMLALYYPQQLRQQTFPDLLLPPCVAVTVTSYEPSLLKSVMLLALTLCLNDKAPVLESMSNSA